MAYFELINGAGQISGLGLLVAWAASQAVLLPVALTKKASSNDVTFKKVALAVTWPILGAGALVAIPFIAVWLSISVLQKLSPIAVAVLSTIDPAVRKLDRKATRLMEALSWAIDHPLQLTLVKRRSFGFKVELVPSRQY
jgi:hypothetical protein